jgi:hypothetical protein
VIQYANDRCPRCGQTVTEGYVSVSIPFAFKWLFFTLTRTVRVEYSFRCGYMNITVV